MTYELAKKLKDAGFPLIPKHICKHETTCDCAISVKPTLKELIKACGDENEFSLQRHDGIWIARKEKESQPFKVESKKVNYTNIAIAVIPCVGNGATPEEAVVELWLALQKK